MTSNLHRDLDALAERDRRASRSRGLPPLRTLRAANQSIKLKN